MACLTDLEANDTSKGRYSKGTDPEGMPGIYTNDDDSIVTLHLDVCESRYYTGDTSKGRYSKGTDPEGMPGIYTNDDDSIVTLHLDVCESRYYTGC